MIVHNLATDAQLYFDGYSYSAEEALVSAHILEQYGATQLHSKELREKLKKQITVGKKTLGLGNFSTLRT